MMFFKLLQNELVAADKFGLYGSKTFKQLTSLYETEKSAKLKMPASQGTIILKELKFKKKIKKWKRKQQQTSKISIMCVIS